MNKSFFLVGERQKMRKARICNKDCYPTGDSSLPSPWERIPYTVSYTTVRSECLHNENMNNFAIKRLEELAACFNFSQEEEGKNIYRHNLYIVFNFKILRYLTRDYSRFHNKRDNRGFFPNFHFPKFPTEISKTSFFPTFPNYFPFFVAHKLLQKRFHLFLFFANLQSALPDNQSKILSLFSVLVGFIYKDCCKKLSSWHRSFGKSMSWRYREQLFSPQKLLFLGFYHGFFSFLPGVKLQGLREVWVVLVVVIMWCFYLPGHLTKCFAKPLL